MDIRAWAALSIFVGVIVAIASGKVKSTTATLLGASVMALSGLLSGDQIVAAIDHNTVGLLVGMMIVVGILSKCGVFQYIAVKAVKVTSGRGSLILWSISFITVILSAFLDNVTTILLVTPVVLSLCDLIGLKPLPFLMMESFASTIGGTGTLIGDPPNMIIGSIAGLSFNDFIRVMTPVALIVWGSVTLYLERCYRAELSAVNAEATARLNQVDESKLITDRRLMAKALLVIFFVLVAFVLQKQIDVEPSVSALTAAAVLLIITGVDDATIIRDEVGWTTIIYFVSLFVMGGGLRATGVITAMAHGIATLFSGSPLAMALGILWVSGIACVFINSAAFAAIFVYVVAEIASATGMPATPLYWALALGACLGGSGSYLGAAANAVMADLAVKNNVGISFGYFMRIGLRVVLISLVISSAAVYVICKLS
ncbi:ArsB/NhaD family transporter [Pyramidobacter porci]